jgi:hypothetical protein
MVIELAPLVVQERVAVSPAVTICGAALNAETVGTTATVVVAVVEPPAFVAVSV